METAAAAEPNRAPLSAFVVAYNREAIIGTCLRALAFADELIVIDKGSTDATAAIASTLADRVIAVPWTPTVEETRAFALAQCTHDWVLFLDDDECLSVEAVRFIATELAAPRADIYLLPQRHYIMGRHDERAYYWPEYQMRLFRRGSIAFTDRVHDGHRRLSDRVHSIPPETGACIHHLSHRDAAQFIEKANRYTSRPDRLRTVQLGTGMARFAHDRVDHWLALTEPCEPDAYPVAVALLRATYDLIDRIKTWEEEAALDGAALFAAECARLDAAYAAGLADLARPHAGSVIAGGTPAAPPAIPPPDAPMLSHAVNALRDSVHALRQAMDAADRTIDAVRADLRAAQDDVRGTLAALAMKQDELDTMRQAEAAQRARAGELEATLGDFSRQHDAMVAGHNADIAAREADRLARAAEHEQAAAEHRQAIASLHAQIAQLTARAEAAEHLAGAMQASTSWRITAPLRALRPGRR